jgi:hypothetical protein
LTASPLHEAHPAGGNQAAGGDRTPQRLVANRVGSQVEAERLFVALQRFNEEDGKVLVAVAGTGQLALWQPLGELRGSRSAAGK